MPDELAAIEAEVSEVIIGACKVCRGADTECECHAKARRIVRAYEACVPKDFWDVQRSDVKHNEAAFDNVIVPYCEKMRMARRHGYGLLLLGENGTGKTMFLSRVLVAAMDEGWSCYYTSMLELDHCVKRGFHDHRVGDRLEEALSADFVAIDELGKEKYREGDSHARLQVERTLKRRFDNSLPTLLAANMTQAELEDVYGKTVGSILAGKYRAVVLEPGDYREELARRMNERMGYE